MDVAAQYIALADQLEPLDSDGWDTPSLCAGWRIREVVAHLTMPVRYPFERFQAELAEVQGDFTNLSNRVASRDAELPTEELLSNLRDERLHNWVPPVGGEAGALSHVVIHALDVTVPLHVEPTSTDDAILAVLGVLVGDGTSTPFGVDISGMHLQASDLEWSFGSGESLVAPAAALVLVLSGREVPAGETASNRS